jgi:cyclopropane-fatty-acyl-phospholipid synthase
LWTTDIEVLRMHYVYTLRHWRANFERHRETIKQMYDERFCRMWEFYLMGAEMDFLHLGTMVFQIQIAKDINTLPLTRDYMFKTMLTTMDSKAAMPVSRVDNSSGLTTAPGGKSR